MLTAICALTFAAAVAVLSVRRILHEHRRLTAAAPTGPPAAERCWVDAHERDEFAALAAILEPELRRRGDARGGLPC